MEADVPVLAAVNQFQFFALFLGNFRSSVPVTVTVIVLVLALLPLNEHLIYSGLLLNLVLIILLAMAVMLIHSLLMVLLKPMVGVCGDPPFF